MSQTISIEDLKIVTMKQVAPLDYDVIGDETALRIAQNTEFQEMSGGHFIDITNSIGLLSGIATLVQIFVSVGMWGYQKTKQRSETKAEQETSEMDSVITQVINKVGDNKEIKLALEENPELIKEVYLALKVIRDGDS